MPVCQLLAVYSSPQNTILKELPGVALLLFGAVAAAFSPRLVKFADGSPQCFPSRLLLLAAGPMMEKSTVESVGDAIVIDELMRS